MRPPEPTEYHEYYGAYIGCVPDRPVLDVLDEAPARLSDALAGLGPGEETFAYAAGKWTIREVVGHVVDTERLFSYRALHMARGDPADLPGMDQDVWARASNAAARPLADQLAEFHALRAANRALFASFDERELSRRGVASEVEFTVRALVYIVAGHEIHHREVLRDRYVAALAGGR